MLRLHIHPAANLHNLARQRGPRQMSQNNATLMVGTAQIAFTAQPNWSFNADATAGHAFGILMACCGILRTSCAGAG